MNFADVMALEALVALDLQPCVSLAFFHLFPEPLRQIHSDHSVWLCSSSKKVELSSLDRYCCLGESSKKREQVNAEAGQYDVS